MISKLLILLSLLSFLLASGPIHQFSFDATSRTDSTHQYYGLIDIYLRGLRWEVQAVSYSKSEDLAYSYVDGSVIAYSHINTNCTSATIPVFNFGDIRNLFEKAIPVDTKHAPLTDVDVKQCVTDGLNLWYVSIEDKEYILCGSGSTLTSTSRIISPDFIVNIEKDGKTIAMDYIKNLQDKCPAEESDDLMIDNSPPINVNAVPITPWFLHENSCKFGYMRHGDDCEKIELASNNGPQEKKDCVFIHGSGELGVNRITEGSLDSYWGKMDQYTPQCKSRIFIDADTKTRGWNDKALQQLVCDTLLYKQPDNGQETADTQEGISPARIVRNRIIFAHSMGNLIMAAAIKNKICGIDRKTTSWYSIMAPYDGSRAANFVEKICLAPNLVKKGLHMLAGYLGYCLKDNKPCVAYSSLRQDFVDPDNMTFKDLRTVAEQNVKGSMCGLSAWGLNSKYAPLLWTLSKVVDHQSDNDGMVAFGSCSVAKEYSRNHKDLFYAEKVNHSDGTCRNGNGWLSAGKPCFYFADKMCLVCLAKTSRALVQRTRCMNASRTLYLKKNLTFTPMARFYSTPGEDMQGTIKNILTEQLSPTKLQLQDISGGCGQSFNILVISESFKGLSELKRNRLVHAALKQQLKTVHALILNCFTEEEFKEKSKKIN
ncbi:hypothetical protein AKO1_007852 [Acrasis kona]|uniref:Uncharacterized protein n=1 Tax=Acrasis kona TaxID=1008807 RepID=A0AAW2YP38_9EUKA